MSTWITRPAAIVYGPSCTGAMARRKQPPTGGTSRNTSLITAFSRGKVSSCSLPPDRPPSPLPARLRPRRPAVRIPALAALPLEHLRNSSRQPCSLR